MVLLTAMTYLDNAWSVATSRARKAGQMLATKLLQLGQTSALGHRPVPLCGYSVGALVIWSCLQELAKAPDGAGEEIVESVFILGAPVAAGEALWRAARRVVAGRFVNGYNPETGCSGHSCDQSMDRS